MQWRKSLRLPGIITIVVTCGLSAQADTLSGTVVDPQQRVIPGAKVSLTCSKHTYNRETDGQGYFTFEQASPKDCKIRAAYPGFAALEITIGPIRNLALQLKLAEIEQAVVATEYISQAPLVSASLSASELRTISGNTTDLIAYAKQMAGVYSDQIMST